MTKEPISKEECLMQLYHEFNCSRMDYNTIKWRTVQFFTSLNGSILTATIALLVYKGVNLDVYSKRLIVLLPVSVIVISYLAMKNLRRESRLLWEQEASMFKIEKYLGFHVHIPKDKRWLEEDSYLVPLKNYDPTEENYKIITHKGWLNLKWKDPTEENYKINTHKEWLNFKWKKNEFKKIIYGVFIVEIAISLLLIILIYVS